MTNLVLSPIGKHYLDLAGAMDHYVVLCRDREIGTIIKSVPSADGGDWLWSITASHRKREHRRADRGRSLTKAEAMADFRHAWDRFNPA